jgi:hypothetical protein
VVTAQHLTVDGCFSPAQTTSVVGELLIDGTSATPFLTSPLLGIQLFTGITTGSAGSRNAGTVNVNAGTLTVLNGGTVQTGTRSSGEGGSVFLDVAGALTISGGGPGFTSISAGTNPGGTGNAGNVAVSAESLTIANGGMINNSTSGAANGLPVSTASAGKVTVNVAGFLSIAGSGSSIATNTLPGQPVMPGRSLYGQGRSRSQRAEKSPAPSPEPVRRLGQRDGAGALVLNGSGEPNTEIAASAIGPQSGSGGSVMVAANSLTVEGGHRSPVPPPGPARAVMSLSSGLRISCCQTLDRK